MPVVTFTREKLTMNAHEGENLLALMRRAGLNPDAPCGGRGKCGKCTVVLNGEKVKACTVEVQEDLTVETLEVAGGAQILTSGMRSEDAFDPLVKELAVTVSPCPAGQSISDWDRLKTALKDQHQIIVNAEAAPDPMLLSQLGPLCKACKGSIYAIVCEGEVLAISAEERPVYMAAFDVGTTTVAGYLINARIGIREAVGSCMNPQTQYGGDVINRANYTLEHGTDEVASCIRAAVNKLLQEMCAQIGRNASDVYALSLVGNTCMHHLFLNISPDSLVHAPYNPVIQEALTLYSGDVQVQAARNAKLFLLPNIAGFVGADTVGCLVSTRLAEEEDWTLLIDIGTNGEMVLGRKGKLTACSTAAGPAFEGAGITHGMRGAAGAISKASYENGKWNLETIGHEKPIGICGSGLLDLVAQLLENGLMDESGAMEEDVTPLVLADAAHSGNGQVITLEQKDVRQLQLAKAAIASGVYLLAEKNGIEVEDIQQVWLAGAFGSFLSPDSACRIGLIPPQLQGRIKAVGNAAGEGAVAVVRSRSDLEYAKHVAEHADFLELAAMPQFQDRFVDELMFPED